ncbi:hypothetical protein CC2G_014873 [Coprinopsis cinerea AmutBmut pab1-1]|nr:hypothetical protein CC2G_014873 [Coprinopsis cinerea AmutBmut pab1-1]
MVKMMLMSLAALGSLSGYAAIPRIGSRFNHSCTPDVQAEFHPKAFALQYTALRDIKAGSQIFASYTSYFMSKAERDEFLAPYGIQCVCRVCVNATPQTDQLRRVCFKMSQNWKKQCDNVWMKDRKLTVDVLKPLLEMKKRMEDEGLDTFEAGYYELWQVMMSVYSKLGMVRKMEECMAVLRVFMEKTREAQFWEGSKFA